MCIYLSNREFYNKFGQVIHFRDDIKTSMKWLLILERREYFERRENFLFIYYVPNLQLLTLARLNNCQAICVILLSILEKLFSLTCYSFAVFL